MSSVGTVSTSAVPSSASSGPARTSSSPTPVSTGGSSASPSGCSGKTYQIKQGDTCQSISASQQISTFDLLQANNLNAYCSNFPQSGTLCIPSTRSCSTYIVKQGDSCGSVAMAANATWTQIVSWNPAVAYDCSQIANLVSYAVCISNPGGSWTIQSIPGQSQPTSAPPSTITSL
jgi:LysM repeat protein